MFLKDTNGDDVADERTIVLHGFDSADSHHCDQRLHLGPGRRTVLSGRDVPSHAGRNAVRPGPLRQDAGVFRYEPRTDKFDVFVSLRLRQPLGPHRRSAGGRTSWPTPPAAPTTIGTAF